MHNDEDEACYYDNPECLVVFKSEGDSHEGGLTLS